MNRKRSFTAMSNNGLNVGMSFSAKRQKIKPLLKWIVGPAIARNMAENVAAEGEESETYDVLVQGEIWVVREEIRDALLRGSVTCISNNGVNARMRFLARRRKVKALLKWIVGPAVARNRARIMRPLH